MGVLSIALHFCTRQCLPRRPRFAASSTKSAREPKAYAFGQRRLNDVSRDCVLSKVWSG